MTGRPRRWLALLASGTTVVATLALGGGEAKGPASSALVFPGVTSFGIAVIEPVAGQPTALGAIPLCVVGTRRLTLEAVSPLDGRGLAVVDYGFRDPPATTGNDLLGITAQGLAELGFRTRGRATISTRCQDGVRAGSSTEAEAREQSAFQEFAVAVRRTGTGSGTSRGLALTYRADGRRESHTLVLPLILTICAAETASDCI